MKKSKIKLKDIILRIDHNDVLKEITRMGSCNPVNSCHHCRDWTQVIYKKQLIGKQQQHQSKENSNYVTAGKFSIAIDSKDTFNRDVDQENENEEKEKLKIKAITTTLNVKKEAAKVLEPILQNYKSKTATTIATPPTYNHNTELLKQCITACEEWMVTPNQFTFLPPLFRQVDFEEEIIDEHFDHITDDIQLQQLKILKAIICDRQGIGLTIDQITLLKGVRKSHLKRVESDPTCCCDIKHDSPSNLQIEIDIINEKMDQAVKEHLTLLNDRLTTCWKPLNDFIIKILNMEKKLNDIVNDGLTKRMDTLISQHHIVPFQDFWTPLVPEFKKKKSGVDVKAVDETFLGYLDQLTLVITDFYTSFVTAVLEELIQFSKEFSVFVLSAIENLMERVTNNTMIVNHLQENGTKFDISKIKESCNIQNQTILKTADSIKDMVGTKLKEHLTGVTELRRIYIEESQPNVAARIEKVAHKDFRKKFKKVEHQYQTIRQHFRYELHKVLLENDWFNDLAIASIQSLMKEGEACESCVIQEAIANFEIKNMELIEAKEELMDMFDHGITTGQHELDTVIGILFIAEAYRLKYDTDAMRKQALFLDSIGATSTNDDTTSSSKKKKKKAKSANTATTFATTTTNDDASEEVKETSDTKEVEENKETKQAQPAITSSTSNTVTSTSTAKSKKVSSDKIEKQSPLDKKSNSKKNDQVTSTIASTTKLNSTKPEAAMTSKSTIKKNTSTSTKSNNSNPSLPSTNNDDTEKNNVEIVSPVTKFANEKAGTKLFFEEPIHIVNSEDISTSNQVNELLSEKVDESSNSLNESTTTKEIRFSKKKESQVEKLNQSQSAEKSGTARSSNKNKKFTQDTSKPVSIPSSNDKTSKNDSWGQEQNQTTEPTESYTTTTPTTKTQTKKKSNQRSKEWVTDGNSTDLGGWNSTSADQTNSNEVSGWGSSPSTNQVNDNVNSGWGTENEDSSDGWQFVGKNTSKKATTPTTTSRNTPISTNESKKPSGHQAQSTSKQVTNDLNGWGKSTNKETKKEVSSGRDMPKNNDPVTSGRRNTTKSTEPTTSSAWGAPKKVKSTSTTSSGWGVVNNIESKKTTSSGWDTPKKVESTVSSCWDIPKKVESTVSNCWDTQKKTESSISSCWDTPINVKTTTSGWEVPKKIESIASNGWDLVNNNNETKKISSPSSSGWSLPNINEPEKNISAGWNPPTMKEPESSAFNNNNNNNRMNYLSGWDALAQSKSDLPSYNNNINNNNINIPTNEPAIVNVSISDLLKSAEQDGYQTSPFLSPMEQKNTASSPPSSSSSSIKPPPMSYPQFLSLPIGSPSASIDQLHGMSTDSLILMIQALQFENEQLKQSMSNLQQTVSMTLALAKDREEQTIQLFNSRKQADLEKARIYTLSLESKIQDLESQIRMQSANNNNINSSNHQPLIARTGFDNQDIFADYREEMRVGSGRNTTNDRFRQYNQRSNTTGNSGKKLWSRTTIVKCSNCGESGHASSDCQDSCRYCDSREHLSEQCPQPF
ncbi:hypothetical protein BJ944DRAFT_246837 [Cunninghamella echinulata]|nr:hypothetical protein BJ944DRAFT_246837 [Cunninghamella echinulata]